MLKTLKRDIGISLMIAFLLSFLIFIYIMLTA